MPDDVEVVEPEVKDEVVEETPEPETEQEEPHPLDPGGKRFDAVYRDMKDARRESADLRERLARLEAEAKKPAPQQPRFFSAQELQTAVDAGRITQAQMADQLAWQRGQQTKQELRAELTQEQKQQAATNEVRAYVDKIPALLDSGSAEFTKVARAAFEIAEEMGLDVRDARVQRRALRETMGSLDRITATRKEREVERRAADTHAETSRGGGIAPSKDPLKTVAPHYIEHWTRLGYTRAQMIEEAKYIKERRR